MAGPPEHLAGGPGEPRISTGSPELDQILHGGLMPRRPYLICGPSGTGKTTLALQFLREGVRRGERCLLVTLEEPPNELIFNHRAMRPEIDPIYVFDAVPDVMRYEHTPFKDIAAVRDSIPLGAVTPGIRKTPELTSVEVTFTALEQTIKNEIVKRNYSRLVIDSLTALQFFCMKGVDETVGAQTFLRFLSDLHVTTILTVELPIEEVESTPERLLARGEIHLFRWERDGQLVRAIGVEKLRGSHHDTRLHPYRIHPTGLQINLELTISRGTGEIIERPAPEDFTPALSATIAPVLASVPFDDSVRWLTALVAELRAADRPIVDVLRELHAADAALLDGAPPIAARHLQEARDLAVQLGRADTSSDGLVLAPRSPALEELLSHAPALGTPVATGALEAMRPTLAALLDRAERAGRLPAVTARPSAPAIAEPPRPPAEPIQPHAAVPPGLPPPPPPPPIVAPAATPSPPEVPTRAGPSPPLPTPTPVEVPPMVPSAPVPVREEPVVPPEPPARVIPPVPTAAPGGGPPPLPQVAEVPTPPRPRSRAAPAAPGPARAAPGPEPSPEAPVLPPAPPAGAPATAAPLPPSVGAPEAPAAGAPPAPSPPAKKPAAPRARRKKAAAVPPATSPGAPAELGTSAVDAPAPPEAAASAPAPPPKRRAPRRKKAPAAAPAPGDPGATDAAASAPPTVPAPPDPGPAASEANPNVPPPGASS